ncbi:hypothetical protein LTR78_005829 [Recurvomyces mirabilis]|uniref:Pre-mRNA-splicing factor 38B n=1 Tax=Recurvomyces mirabilis TaxID=574656 RepID=A0AAE0WMB4_9PEZI|nr:hypothetical protein LTR78_005829 [Recurvomyces mirabilis]KAK5154209.1 hypothetical protein LTS14_006894 [Recurvomyces mirabilis]
MPLGEALDDNDDYIISLLKRDAEANKNQYPLLSGGGNVRRRAKDAPKPNTRFLGNLVREVDSHNAALKAKEEAESRARLRDLKREEQGRKDGGGERPKKKARTGEREGRWASAFGGLGVDGSRREGKRSERRSGRDERDGSRARQRAKSPQRKTDSSRVRNYDKRSRRDDRSSSPDDRKKRRRRSSSEDGRQRSSSPRPSKSRHQKHSPEPAPHRSRHQQEESISDLDPPEPFLGPAPPTKNLPRGRGAFKPSTIDSRFSSTYDPKTDLSDPDDLEAEGDDWDMALEALRDRMKWRTQGAARLRAAGFTEEEVERAQASRSAGDGGKGREKGVEDVRWAKLGEGREWDRGKVEEGDGVEIRAAWAT